MGAGRSCFATLLGLSFPAAADRHQQAHLGISRGLPFAPIPIERRPVQGASVNYGKPVVLGGDRSKTSDAAAKFVAGQATPFQFWDVTHVHGPSIFDCPDGFVMSDNLCVFVEYRAPEETCPYGSYRQKDGRCIQVDSVPPERSCPAGFQYFMKGCIRRTKVRPTLTCASGYTQIDDSCYSVSTVQAKLSCPPGFSLDESNDVRICSKVKMSKPRWSCEGSEDNASLKPPRCENSQLFHMTKVCPDGFRLSQTESGGSNSTGENVHCVKGVLYEGSLVCPPQFTLSWPTHLQLLHMEPPETDMYYWGRCFSAGSELGSEIIPVDATHEDRNHVFEVYSAAPPAAIPLVVRRASVDGKMNMSPVIKRILSDKNSLTMVPEILFERKACMRVNVTELQWVEDGTNQLPEFLKGDKGSKIAVTHFVTPPQPSRVADATSRSWTPYCAEIQRIPYKLACPSDSVMVCAKKHTSIVQPEAVRQPSECEDQGLATRCMRALNALPAIPVCDLPNLLEYHAETIDHGTAVDKQVLPESGTAYCVHRESVEPTRKCPLGTSQHSDRGGCEVLMGEPIEATCPPGYHRGSQNLEGVSSDRKKGVKILGSPANVHYEPDFCELIEYADYQITCPEGYRRDRAKNTKAACLGKKIVPSSILCSAGFVPAVGDVVTTAADPRACVKTIVVAPTIISHPSETVPVTSDVVHGASATACIVTKGGLLSCGIERKYFGANEGEKLKTPRKTYRDHKI